jgi:omega-6 fatty acid desaturase (delta-12 desaturase)
MIRHFDGALMNAIALSSNLGVSGDTLRDITTIAEENRTLARGLRVFAVHFSFYIATLIGAIAQLPVALNLVFSIANGVLIALLFIIGHDAGHNSFVPGALWNRWLARIAFVPCVHGASLWRVVHNEQHHARTNLKGVDGVWVPMSPEEYRRASAMRRLLERVYRGAAGPIVYYYVVFWIHRVLFPLAPEVRKEWRRHLPDSAFAFVGLILTLMVIAVSGKALTPDRPLWLVFLTGWAIPFAVWNYLMGFTIYLNHTHPLIPWFDDEERWRQLRALAPDTASIVMPVNLVPLYTKVMAHSSHHVQTRIPVYLLPEAEGELRKGYSRLLEYRLSVRAYRSIYKTCKLFDYKRMCWTGFDGVPTAWPLPSSSLP